MQKLAKRQIGIKQLARFRVVKFEGICSSAKIINSELYCNFTWKHYRDYPRIFLKNSARILIESIGNPSFVKSWIGNLNE